MDNEKVVVVLLIITIALSVVSMIIAFSGPSGFDVPQRTALDNPDAQGNIVFGLEQAPDAGGTG